MLWSFISILASNYPLQIKLIEEVTKQSSFNSILLVSWNLASNVASNMRVNCVVSQPEKNEINNVKLGWLACQTVFWGDVNRNDCYSPDLFPFNEQWMFILTATYEKGPDAGKFPYDCSIYNSISTTSFPGSQNFIITANPWWLAPA